jgi:hypothetical protein
MIKPTIALVAVACFASPSALAATLPASEADISSRQAALPLLNPSSPVRRAAAAGVPPRERKLQPAGPVCYVFGTSGEAPPVLQCSYFGCSGSVGCADESDCLDKAKQNCQVDDGFEFRGRGRWFGMALFVLRLATRRIVSTTQDSKTALIEGRIPP